MRFALALCLALGASTIASAHSWYPWECCSDRDCEELKDDQVKITPQGYVLPDGVVVEASKARQSPDGHYHWCRQPDGKLICFFAPPNGF